MAGEMEINNDNNSDVDEENMHSDEDEEFINQVVIVFQYVT